MTGRVLVGIPTRNRPQYVRQAIQSVLSQTEQDFRVLVSDNASDPASAEEVAGYVESLADPRVSYHLHEKDGKEYGQGRFLIGRCSETFFVILHDDDLLQPRFLEVALARLDKNLNLAAWVANPYVFEADGAVSEELTRQYRSEHGRDRFREGEVEILEPLLRFGFFPISGTVFRTSALGASGFVDDDCHGNYPFEFNLLLRLGERSARAYFTEEVLLGFRFHRGSLRSSMRIKFNEQVMATMIKLLERRRFAGRNERLRRKILAYTNRNYGLIRLAKGDSRSSRNHLGRALRLNPLSYRNWLYCLGAFLFPFALRPLFRSKVVFSG